MWWKKLIVALMVAILLCLVFELGSRWEANCIRMDLIEKGVALTQYGDSKYIEITGTIKEIRN